MSTAMPLTTPHPYPAYKPSAVLWIGDLPEHWEVWRGKAILRPVDVRSETGDEELLTVSAQRGVVPRRSANVTMFKAESYVGYKLCWPGDLVINSLWAWAHGLGVSLHHGIVSSAYGVYRPLPRANARFIHLLVRSVPFQWELQVRSKGIWVSRLQLTDESFLEAPFPLPPVAEQAAIVRYLDYVDRRIRRHVAAKRKLIALLEEERQAVVNRAVTRGLDSNVRLKPSGVEWLGDVPEHWETMRARFLFEEVDTRSTSGKETHLSMSQTLGLVPSHLVEQSLISDSYIGGKLCQEGDLVLNRLKAHLGVFALAKQAGVISPDYSVFRKRGSLKMAYFFRVLRLPALRTELRIRAKGIVEGFWRLYTDDFFDIRLPVPPYLEQQAIVEYVHRATTDVDAAITRARRQIELVEEYRTRLIADVVTGKLDVREAAAQLPDEADHQGSVEEGSPMLDGLDEEIYDSQEAPAIAEEVRI